MSILGRYILRAVLGYTALAMLVLLALGALFLFISEQGDIGTGNYTASQAMMFVLLSLPTFAGQLLTIDALIGALLALGNLARGSELVVMRASGITTARFCWWLAVAGMLLAVLMVSMSEFVAPPMEKYARQLKVFSKFSEFSFAGNRGTWVRDDDTIVSVEQQSSASRFGGVQLFRFDAKRRLLTIARAESASVNRENTWSLDTVSLHLEAQGLASPFSWELSIRSRGSVLCSYSGEDSRIDTLFHDEGYVSGCKGYLDCKQKYYFHDVLEDLEVSYNLDWILDRTHSNSLFSIGKAYLESCCALCGAAADAVLESMEERLRNGQAVVIRIPTSPYTYERPMMFVPEVGALCRYTRSDAFRRHSRHARRGRDGRAPGFSTCPDRTRPGGTHPPMGLARRLRGGPEDLAFCGPRIRHRILAHDHLAPPDDFGGALPHFAAPPYTGRSHPLWVSRFPRTRAK